MTYGAAQIMQSNASIKDLAEPGTTRHAHAKIEPSEAVSLT
jgi:hypothetical protein